MIKKVTDRIRETIDQHNLIKKGDVVILGLSGGPDSLCLFQVLLELSSEIGFELHCAHINHMLRPGEAQDDQMFVENLCSNNGICCWSKVADCNALANQMKMTSEEAGRKVRYDFFADIVQSLAYEGVPEENLKVAVAHNKDDQAETILFRILRGTGTDGLAGIEYFNVNEQGTQIIRPILDVPRDDIEKYCLQANLEPRIDNTNLLPIYGRNKIRLNVIPFLEENYNPNMKDALVRMGMIAKEDRNFLWECTLDAYREAMIAEKQNEVLLSQIKLAEMQPAIRNRVILHAFDKIGLATDISHVHMQESEKLILEGVTPQQIDFPKGYVLRVSYNNICCAKETLNINDNKIKKPDINISVLDINNYEKKADIAAFDLDLMEAEFGRRKIQDLICIRQRIAGDYIRLPGLKGRKKIQDLFVDMKVPVYLRDEIFMVTVGHEVLWIPRFLGTEYKRGRFSGNYKISENTKRILAVEITKDLW